MKQQVFIFFNSINEIEEFSKLFDSMASDFTSTQSEYLESVSKGILAAKHYKDGKKVDTTIQEK